MEIRQICKPTSEMELAQFEDKLNRRLPEDYRQFLLKHNGGEPHPSTFFISQGQGEDDIRHFLGMSEMKEYSLVHYHEIYSGRIPQNLLPIAPDYFSNLVCLSIDGADRGSVYFWDHDWEVVEGEPDYSNVQLLAEGFDDFLERLYTYGR